MDNCPHCLHIDQDDFVCRVSQNGIQKEYYCGSCGCTISDHQGIVSTHFGEVCAKELMERFKNVL